ncbi:TetR/AcrR family transcriptional regulator [Kitasatospora aureofaciens]|uniref:TetR/AcrR family transcriptional regulator n=1 Tax=Kitasatospora aureofaciens TaxID=1894 RepID=UPI00068B77FE|nr:TetR/AcrR family transcriptional regulator [Kitasatospora aureofaciens]HJD83126.1 TetR/AcrR family transcriptional regulator [Kitasatospora aureofaciens]
MAKQERARRTREKVLTAAAEVFAVQGYDSTTLNTVAERIAMTKGALYGHFPSKRSLARALIDESRHTWTSLHAAYDVPGADAAEVLQGVVVGFTDRLRSDVRLRAALRLAVDHPDLAPARCDVLAEMHDALTDLVRRAQRDSGFPGHCPPLVAELLLTVVRGLLTTAERTADNTTTDDSTADCGGTANTVAANSPADNSPAPRSGEPLWRLLFTALSADPAPTPALP